jgi:hypothetical protein
MTRHRIAHITALVAALGLGQAVLAAPSFAGEPAVALTDNNQLRFFDTDTPQTIIRSLAVTGLQPAEGLIAIDFRPGGTDPLAGALYAISADSRIYTIDTFSGVATPVTGTNPIAPLLASPVAGFDFNPQADRLRIVTPDEQNLRAVPSPISTFTDTALTGVTEVSAAAYTENYPAARSTTLFTIDSAADTLVRQGVAGGGNAPATDGPNGGVGTTIGPLGVDTTAATTSFDISAGGGRAFAGLTPPSSSTTSLYTIDLTSGAATLKGPIGGGQAIRGLSLAPGGAIDLPLAATFAPEEAGPAKVTIRRSGGDLRATNVSYALLPTGATAADFALSSGLVSFAAGQTTSTLDIPITNDTADEPVESFLVTLLAPAAGTVMAERQSSTVFILDDDAAPVVPAVAPLGVTLSAKPARDRRKPYVFTASGQVKLPAGVPATACAGGKVTIRLKHGVGTLVTRTAALDAACKYSQKLTYKVGGSGVLRASRTLRITARFTGTARLKASNAPTKTVKAG